MNPDGRILIKIFLTGGTGYLGAAVRDALLRHGHDVLAPTRTAEKALVLHDGGAAPVLGALDDALAAW